MQPATFRSPSSYADRIRGILSLNPATFREVEEDTDATGQAALTVILAALASGVGALLSRDILSNALGIGVSSILQWIEECMAKESWWIHVQSSADMFPVAPTPPATPGPGPTRPPWGWRACSARAA